MSNIINKSFNLEVDSEFPFMPPCMRCQPIIDYTNLRFHSSSIETPIELFDSENSNNTFGILDIKIRSEIPIVSKHVHMFFTIDASGSMSDRCSDGRTKMAHIHHTLENMLRLFHDNKDCKISIHIQSFDTIVKTVISNVPNIHNGNLDLFTNLINNIRPGGSTNIEIALEKAAEQINQYHIDNPEHEIVHIFLTDGDITEGSNDLNLLQDLVPKNCSNIFIGYGIDHDSHLLSNLSSNKGNEYRFIDALEKAGLVYGEIIHGILYKAIEDVTLIAINGELYDFQTNKWLPTLQIGNLLSEQIKTFHIRSKNSNDCHVNIIGKTIIKTRQFQSINIYETQADVFQINYISGTNDLGIYMFRQRTQELLYCARKISEKYKRNIQTYDPMIMIDESNILHEDSLLSLSEESKNIKDKLNQFHKIMINYMKEKNLETNSIMKMLCDDIYIAYKTIGTPLGSMYTCARQTSNGRQQTYMCSATHTSEMYNSNSINNRNIRRLQLQRQTNGPIVNFSEQINVFDIEYDEQQDDLERYIPTQDFLSPFSSDGILTLMREVSGNNSIGYTEDDDISEQTTKIN